MTTAKHALVQFYLGTGPDGQGRRIDQIWQWGNMKLELEHDWVQWLFPLREPSQFYPEAPVASEEVVQTFRREPVLQHRLARSFERFVRFLGLRVQGEGRVKVVRGPDFEARVKQWMIPGGHNYLRITRVLKSMTVLGQKGSADALLERLVELFRERSDVIGDDTLNYWVKAVQAK